MSVRISLEYKQIQTNHNQIYIQEIVLIIQVIHSSSRLTKLTCNLDARLSFDKVKWYVPKKEEWDLEEYEYKSVS